MPYKPGDIASKSLINNINYFIDDDKIIVTAVPEAPINWEAGSLLTTTASGGWKAINASDPITELPIGRVVSTPTDDGTSVIRLTGSSMTDFPVLRTEPSHPTYTNTISTRPILPITEPIPNDQNQWSGTIHFEGNAPELIEQLQDMMAPGSRLVLNGDAIWYNQAPPRTVKFDPTKKTRKPRKKQEKIKTIKDQMKDIP